MNAQNYHETSALMHAMAVDGVETLVLDFRADATATDENGLNA